MGKCCRGWSSLIPIVVFRGDYIINHEFLKQIPPEIWITNHEISTVAEKSPSQKKRSYSNHPFSGAMLVSGSVFRINLHTSSPSKLKSDRRIIPPNAMAPRFPREVQHHGLCQPYWLRSFQRTPGTTTCTWKLRKTPGAEGWLYGCGVWCVCFLVAFFGCFCF